MTNDHLSRLEIIVRDANPVPRPLDLVDSEESSAVALLVRQARDAMISTHKPKPQLDRPISEGASPQWYRARAFGLTMVLVIAGVGIAATVLRGGEAPVTNQPNVPQDAVDPATAGQALPTGSTPLPDFAGALPGDDGTGPQPLGVAGVVPSNDRLNFLFEFCRPECYRDAHFMDPKSPHIGSGVWVAGRPFHVRHGFINQSAEPLGAGFDVVVYVTELNKPGEFSGQGIGETHRYTSDYVLRGISAQCGPTYETQTGSEPCEWFVHDFPDGLPEGRFAIWAVWEAPCSAWADLGLSGTCDDPDEVVSLFSSGFDAPFGPLTPSFTEVNQAQLSPEEVMEFYEGLQPDFSPGPLVDPATVRSDEVASSSDAVPPANGDGSLDAGAPPLALGVRTELPDTARLEFLATLCWDRCYRDAHLIDPSDDRMGYGRWAADLPFHIRQGFVNEAEAPLGDDFEVVIQVTRREGPELDVDAYQIDQTYRFSSDFVLRDTTAKCGPGYWDQTQPQTCEWFVHDFSDGLPPGRYDIWAEWYAPCSAWADLGLVGGCRDPGAITSQFASSVNMPFYGEGFGEGMQLPFDPYMYPEATTRGATTR